MDDSTGGWDVETEAPEGDRAASESPHDPGATVDGEAGGSTSELESTTEGASSEV